MKKYFFLILLGFIFLLPTDTFALYEAANVPWFNTSSSSSSLPLYDNTRYRYQTYTAQTASTVVSFYSQNLNFTANKYDYLLIDVFVETFGETFSYNSNSEYIDAMESSFTVYVEYIKGSSYLRGVCYTLGSSQNSDYIVNNLYCPVISSTTGIRRVIFEINNGAYVYTEVGLSDWFNYHLIDTDASTITSAINSQTSDITDAQQETTNAIDDVNDTLSDDTGNSDSDNQSAINDFNSNIASNGTISSLITMPITLFQKVINSLNGSCSNFNLGSLLGTNVTFPCINPASYLGSSLWSIIDIIISGLFVWAISKKMIQIFNDFSSLKDGKDLVGDD